MFENLEVRADQLEGGDYLRSRGETVKSALIVAGTVRVQTRYETLTGRRGEDWFTIPADAILHVTRPPQAECTHHSPAVTATGELVCVVCREIL